MLEKVGQSLTKEDMVGNGEVNVDLATREATQRQEQAAWDAEEAAIRDAYIIYEEERGHIIAQNQPLANSFELKQGLLQTLQNCSVFRGKPNEDLNTHIMGFEEIMNTFQYNGVSQDAVCLMAFPFSLKDNAKQWLQSLLTKSIRTWEEMNKKFLDKYFSSSKTGKFRREIHNFCHKENETIFEAWERFKEIVQLDAMDKEIRKLTLASIQSEPHTTCDISGRGHPTHECQASTEEVNAVGNYNFNAMGQRHPVFLWSSSGGTADAWKQNNSRATWKRSANILKSAEAAISALTAHSG
ncbi:uncharacterized protein [Nicotiana tomentosiformis]|uniref:uncharacterized protein n=1 Tax=Nicotiana tomentosiformis TaxID=4098 RepID=UPI00388C71CD